MQSVKSVAVIGLGNIGILYDLVDNNSWKPNQVMTHVNSVLKSQNFEIKYLIDNNLEALNKVKKVLPNILCDTLDNLIEFPAPDLIIISTKTSSHLEVIQKVSNKWKNCNFLIEKPVGMDSYESIEIFKLLADSKKIIAINYFRRFMPIYTQLQNLEIFKSRGALESVSINAYGTLKNIFSHFFDLIIFLEGRDSLSLGKKESILSKPDIVSFRLGDTEVVFNLYGVGKFKNDNYMVLKYKNIILKIIRNGQIIQIYDKKKQLLNTLDTGFDTFHQYQSMVLDKIYKDFEKPPDYSGFLDAIHIHKFIESI